MEGVKSWVTRDLPELMKKSYQDLSYDARGAIFAILVFLVLSIVAITYGPTSSNLVESPAIDTGDTAWLLTSTALVLLMTPGLAFFYGGMVHKTSILYTMMQSILAMAFVTVIWTFVGFSVAFGDDIGAGVIGNPATYFMYRNVGNAPDPELAPTIPLGLFSIFQLKFAIISPGLVSGAFTERIAFAPYCVYMLLFCLLVYCPIAHSVWHPQGFLKVWGVLDFAGGTVVETATGYSALAGGIIFNRRSSPGHEQDRVKRHPHIPYVVLGTALLWFGWFGFNSGSALRADGLAMQSFLNTNVAAAAGMITWMLMDKVKGLKPSVTGACVGAVVGMVVITPACGFVSTGGSFICGIVGGMFCNIMASSLGRSNHVHDQLDVFAAHGLGGTIGMILTGCLADKNVNPAGGWGLFYGGVSIFIKNLVAAVGVAVYAFVMSYVIFLFIGLFLDLHVEEDAKAVGLDVTVHGETIVCFDDVDGNQVRFRLHKRNGNRKAAAYDYDDDGDDVDEEEGGDYMSSRRPRHHRHHKGSRYAEQRGREEEEDGEVVSSPLSRSRHSDSSSKSNGNHHHIFHSGSESKREVEIVTTPQLVE